MRGLQNWMKRHTPVFRGKKLKNTMKKSAAYTRLYTVIKLVTSILQVNQPVVATNNILSF